MACIAYLPPPTGAAGDHVPNHLVWAILSTVFCCLPLGIVSIVYAAQVDGKRAAGDLAGAREASRNACFWAILAAALALILLTLHPLFVLAIFVFGVLGGMAGVH